MSDEESVDLTAGVVWTDAQLDVVRDLTARAFRAEDTLRRAHDLAVEMINHPDDSAADWGYDLAYQLGMLDVEPPRGCTCLPAGPTCDQCEAIALTDADGSR